MNRVFRELFWGAPAPRTPKLWRQLFSWVCFGPFVSYRSGGAALSWVLRPRCGGHSFSYLSLAWPGYTVMFCCELTRNCKISLRFIPLVARHLEIASPKLTNRGKEMGKDKRDKRSTRRSRDHRTSRAGVRSMPKEKSSQATPISSPPRGKQPDPEIKFTLISQAYRKPGISRCNERVRPKNNPEQRRLAPQALMRLRIRTA